MILRFYFEYEWIVLNHERDEHEAMKILYGFCSFLNPRWTQFTFNFRKTEIPNEIIAPSEEAAFIESFKLWNH